MGATHGMPHSAQREQQAGTPSSNSAAPEGISELELQIQRALQLDEEERQQTRLTAVGGLRRQISAPTTPKKTPQAHQPMARPRAGHSTPERSHPGAASVLPVGTPDLLQQCVVFFPVSPDEFEAESGKARHLRGFPGQALGFGTALLLSRKAATGWRNLHGLKSGKFVSLVEAFHLARKHFAFAEPHKQLWN